MRQLTKEELAAKRQAKAEASQYTSAHLNHIDQQKRAQLESKKNDTTNFQQTVALQEETSHKVHQNNIARNSSLKRMSTDLDAQKNIANNMRQHEKSQDFQRDIASTGLEFECYTRDPIIR